MTHLSALQRETLKRALEQRAEALRAEIRAPLTQSADAPGLPNHYGDVDDDAVADLVGSVEIANLERDDRELGEVMAALERLRGPDYGKCMECGVDIPLARLLAVPTARRCVACESRQEFPAQAVARNTL